ASVVEAARGADVLVHDATFCADESARAQETMHSTAAAAARIAAEAGVELLALVHLSSRYGARASLEEARAVFANTVVPRDFDLVTIPFPERGRPELIPKGARARPAGIGSET